MEERNAECRELTGGRKALHALLKTVGILVLYGGILLVFLFFGLMGMFPLYVTEGIGALGVVLLVAVVLNISGYCSPKFKKWMWVCVLLAVLGACGWIGAGLYEDSLASLEDAERDKMLWKYEPFMEDSMAVTLEEPASLQLTSEEAAGLRLDGATALYPVYAGFVQAVYPSAGDYGLYNPYSSDGYGAVTCSGTTEAYERLLAGDVDMIFVAGPSDSQLERAKNLGMKFHLTPVGREAFVFFVNSENPVENLTVEQIQKIYSGEITRWSEVGGRSQKIRPFQRDENSGSQTALQRLMGDIPIMEPEEEDRVSGMGGIIRQVASYRNYKNALGFSFRYYSTEMVADGDIKLLALNGVEPTKDTIRDGSYPVASSFYAVTAAPIGEPAPEKTDDNLAAFLNWILTEEGQWVIEETGYVGIR